MGDLRPHSKSYRNARPLLRSLRPPWRKPQRRCLPVSWKQKRLGLWASSVEDAFQRIKRMLLVVREHLDIAYSINQSLHVFLIEFAGLRLEANLSSCHVTSHRPAMPVQ